MLSKEQLITMRDRCTTDLREILDFFADRSTDPAGGFYGKVGRDLVPVYDAPRALVYVGRMLWTYAAAYRILHDEKYLKVAYHALDYIEKCFIDKEHGGAYWEVNPDGTVHDDHKYVYGQCFLIYGGAELMRACGEERGLKLAKDIYHLLEKYAEDKPNGGYFETYDRAWNRVDVSFNIPDPALGSKALNTHLHLIESYTNLMRVWDDKDLHTKVGKLIDIMTDKLLDKEFFHYKPYMTDEWGTTKSLFSFGHDIEASWLLIEAVHAFGDESLLEKCKPIALHIADSCADGLDPETGGMYAEYEEGHILKDMNWWVQSEAVVGFYNAYELTDDEKYLQLMERVWAYIDNVVVDREDGIYRDWFSMADKPKDHERNLYPINGWKTPYHNGRMYMELIERAEKAL